MVKKHSSDNSTQATFEVRFVAPGLRPDKIPLRAVGEALSAVQDLAAGRDPYDTPHVPPEKGIGLVDVRGGSAIYSCTSRAPDEALENLGRLGLILSEEEGAQQIDGDELVAALGPIETLSRVAKKIACRIIISPVKSRSEPLVAFSEDDYDRISRRVLLSGETTIAGTVGRVGGVTGMKCALRVHGRTRLLYCNVRNKCLVRRLGQCLYEEILATGTAVWIHRSWRVHRFTINDFSQPGLGDSVDAIENLRAAGLSAWDNIDNPEAFISELRS